MKTVEALPRSLAVGTMMVQDGVPVPQTMDMQTIVYSKGWRSVNILDSSALGRELARVGWHLFFIAGHITTVALGRGGARSLHKAVKRVAEKVRNIDFNCLELTDIVRKRFLGVPYVLVCAHAYHIQEGWHIQDSGGRKRLQQDRDWARR